MLWLILGDVLPFNPPAEQDTKLYWYIGGGVGGLIVLLILFRVLFGSRRGQPDLQKNLRENLAEYPPPPKSSGKKLTLHGAPVRIRLVVVCPTGKQLSRLQPDDVSEVLDDVLHGLGEFVGSDKPRVRVWPPQLSVDGFAPTFHRLVESPDGAAAKSVWILAAGPARAAGKPILLGIAFLAETPVKFGQMILEAKDWPEMLRIER